MLIAQVANEILQEAVLETVTTWFNEETGNQN